MSDNRYKKSARITNWKEYNTAVEARGSLAVLGVRLVAGAWRSNRKTGERGRPELYNRAFLEAILVLMTALRLPLRQTRGMVAAVLKKQAGKAIPSIATLCRYRQEKGVKARIFRQARVFTDVLREAKKRGEPLTLLVDSTGISIRGVGTWRTDKPGSTEAKVRRTYWKLHTLVDPVTGKVAGADLESDPGVSDSFVGSRLLGALPVDTQLHSLAADGAYDTREFYTALEDAGVEKSLVKPRENAAAWEDDVTGAGLRNPLVTMETRSAIIVPGSLAWKKLTGYSVRSLIESSYSRLSSMGANRPRSRSDTGRMGEITTALELLNRYASIGMPERYQRMWPVA